MTKEKSSLSAKVAVIGLALRVPGAGNEFEFWRNLTSGIESITTFSDDELELDASQYHLLRNPDYIKRGGILENIDQFDAELFGYSAREAQLIDPQQRLFLQACWEALENAGYNSETYPGSIGLYAGSGINTYLCLNVLPAADLADFALLQSIITANDKDYLCSRVAYKLNLRGPAVVVQTACSTSLVAVHYACQSVLSGECDIALAGGVSVRVPHRSGYLYHKGGIFSPDGHCRPFDAGACGTVPANGLGVVVLKRLSDALVDGDNIRAVILGSAVNNDGSGKAGFMAPSVAGQASVIAEAQAIAGVQPHKIGYVEAHGTGTELGDPIEVRALSKVFNNRSKRTSTCALGSVKGNIGHLDTAAGVIGLIKAILCLNHRMLPPTLHFERPNPHVEFARTPFRVNNDLEPWQREHGPLRAGVSSFGIGGTNAHVVVEEAPAAEQTQSQPQSLLLLSARTESGLNEMVRNTRRYYAEHAEIQLADMAYTLHVGRRSFAHRTFMLARDRADLIDLLNDSNAERVTVGVFNGKSRSVSFLFPGQGGEYVGMGAGLYASVEAFRRSMDHCSEVLKTRLGVALTELLYPPAARWESSVEALSRADCAHAALFSTQYALAQSLIEWGLQPEAVMGSGVGEYAAACVSGVLPLEIATELVVATSRHDGLRSTKMDVDLSRGKLRAPVIPLICNLTETWITNEQATDLQYWSTPLRKQLTRRSVKTLLEDTDSQLVQLASNANFLNFVHESGAEARTPVPMLRDAVQAGTDLEFLWQAVGQLWLNGVAINWEALSSGQRRRRVPLPTYAFDPQRYWIAAPTRNVQQIENRAPTTGGAARREGLPEYVPPRTETETQLVKIWEELLGCAPIGISDDFFDLGGDSLVALQIGSRLRSICSTEIPIQELTHATTIEQLGTLIDAANKPMTRAPDPAAGFKAIFGSSPIVPLHVGKSDPAFFCIHPVGGSVLCYMPLARRLGPEQTVYAIQAPSLCGESEPESLEERSRYYVELVRQIQPSGPYLIGGHSYGGNVAFEMAAQLVQSGESMALVALMDSYPPVAYVELQAPERLRAIFPQTVASYLNVEAAPDETLSSLVIKLQKLYPNINMEIVEHIFKIWVKHFEELHAHKTIPAYRGRVAYFCCDGEESAGIVDLAASRLTKQDLEAAWTSLSSAPIVVYAVPGNHLALLRAPYVDTLALNLRQVIEQSVSHSNAVVTAGS